MSASKIGLYFTLVITGEVIIGQISVQKSKFANSAKFPRRPDPKDADLTEIVICKPPRIFQIVATLKLLYDTVLSVKMLLSGPQSL